MSDVVRTVAAIRAAVSSRLDLLFEVLALRHQVTVLARANRRFRRSDRLLWLMLRRVWPRWREALELVQPATVDRWHREWFRRRWWHRSRRPGRPRIEPAWRELIRRLAEENPLWGAPRIHGELLKLGMVVSERTVSRYLREQPRRPSQTWRTFLANHFGQLTFRSQILSSHASDDAIVDAFARTWCPLPSAEYVAASRQCALAAWPASVRRVGLTYAALRIIFVTAQACDGALAGPHRGLGAWSWLTSMLKVDCGPQAADQLRRLRRKTAQFRARGERQPTRIRIRLVRDVWSFVHGRDNGEAHGATGSRAGRGPSCTFLLADHAIGVPSTSVALTGTVGHCTLTMLMTGVIL
ncbi:MAG TPA: helix-turn-helix domain-containing protein [Vicinamibacterales bacterium]|nr:helix-turn-helix domain-containing protein [Vicinamibacterales bacterium]